MATIADILPSLMGKTAPHIKGGGVGGASIGKGKPAQNARSARFAALLEKAQSDAQGPDGILSDLDFSALPDGPEAIVLLQDAVQSAGDDLKNRPFPEEIRRYKQAVRFFLRYVIEKGYAVEDQTGVPNYQKSGYAGRISDPRAKECKSFHIIQVVDDKLERLAAAILTGQTSQINLLKRLEEIHGILINLLH